LQRYVTHGFTVPKHFPGDMDKELYTSWRKIKDSSSKLTRNLVHNQTIDKTKSIDIYHTEEYRRYNESWEPRHWT
jgi:hypothetical protein